ncbi:hypothetical protein [Mycobacterium tuberculosis]|uniref:hypothetical protein n=1 Tax=Mycobacterium tuberculosis TaxID=1773 RepID=UPI0004B6FFFC|nr:hypothetical protein [Mycobacterium tuberculosis]
MQEEIDERRRMNGQLKHTQRQRITGRCAGGPDPADDDEGLRAYVARYLVPGIVRLAPS